MFYKRILIYLLIVSLLSVIASGAFSQEKGLLRFEAGKRVAMSAREGLGEKLLAMSFESERSRDLSSSFKYAFIGSFLNAEDQIFHKRMISLERRIETLLNDNFRSAVIDCESGKDARCLYLLRVGLKAACYLDSEVKDKTKIYLKKLIE